MSDSRYGGRFEFTRILSASHNSNDEFDGLYGLREFVDEAELRQRDVETTYLVSR
jgi:hypothetical protein